MVKVVTTDVPKLAATVFMVASLVPATIVGMLASSFIGAAVTAYIVSLLALIVVHLGLVHKGRRGLVYVLQTTSESSGKTTTPELRLFREAFFPK